MMLDKTHNRISQSDIRINEKYGHFFQLSMVFIFSMLTEI